MGFVAIARYQGMSDSALLKRLVEAMLQTTYLVEIVGPTYVAATRNRRVTVRLRPEDQLLLWERAAARGMSPATYVSV